MSVNRKSKSTRGRHGGFTLIELMVTLTVLVVLITIAVPSFDGVRLSTRLNSYATALVAGGQLARSEAIKRNAPVTLCVSADGASCGTSGQWETGWIVVSGTKVLLQQPAAAGGYQLRDTRRGERPHLPGHRRRRQPGQHHDLPGLAQRRPDPPGQHQRHGPDQRQACGRWNLRRVKANCKQWSKAFTCDYCT